MDKDVIYFTGKPFMAHVSSKENKSLMARILGKKNKLIECTPIVCDVWHHSGIGIIFEDGTMQTWGLVSPRNLIAAWRGAEMLHHLNTIENGTLRGVYCAGISNPNIPDGIHANPIIEKIGKDAYDRIMSRPIPDKIIRLVLDDYQNYGSNSILCHLVEGLENGTIEWDKWRREFVVLGIKDPSKYE